MQHSSWKTLRRWCVTAVLGGLLLAGCGYGEVTPRCYDYAKALYSICNRRDAERLQEFTQLVETDLQAGELAEREADWLQEIADQARSGDWSAAQAASRQLLEDQVQGR